MTTSGPPRSHTAARPALRGLCALISLLALQHLASARAEAQAVVLVAVEGRPGKLEEQLRAELLAANLTPQSVAWSDVSVRPDGLLTLRDPQRAVALLHLTRSPMAVDVWLAERDLGGLTRRESVRRASDDADARLVAMRASELVRAALLPVSAEAQHAAPPGTAESSDTTPLAVPREPSAIVPDKPSAVDGPAVVSAAKPPLPAAVEPSFGGGLGTALSRDRDGFGRAVRVKLDASWRMHDRWTLAAMTVLPTTAQVIRETTGKVALRAGLFALEVRRELVAPTARLRPRIGLGAGLAWTHLRTRTNTPLSVHRTTQLEACLLALVGGSVRVWSRVSLALDFRAGAALPRTVARIDGQKVGSTGVPMLIGSLSLEVPFG